MIKNFKKLFATILVFILSSVYVINISAFAEEIYFPFQMEDFERCADTTLSYPFGDFKTASHSLNFDLKAQLDEIFNSLKVIHPEINCKIDSDKKKLAFVCFYLYDLLSSKKSSSGMQSFNLITYLYYNNIRNVISRAVWDLYQINLENINLGIIGDGFDCIYELSYYLKTRLCSDLNNEFSIEMSSSEIENVFYENNLYQIFKPILNDDNFHEVTQEKYFELRTSARFDFK